MAFDRVEVRRLEAAEAEAATREFGALLRACVADGASVGFVCPFSQAEAEAFWRDRVWPALRSGARRLFVAEIDPGAAAASGRRILGTAQLDLDTMPNQPHRAEVAKLMIAPSARRRGLARRLMAALEREAIAAGRRLLTLDTRTGDAAEPLYASLGFETVGVIPDYCLDPFDPRRLDSTTIMFKRIGAEQG